MLRLLNKCIPRPVSNGPPVALLRAHKTAGESFSAGLQRAFRQSDICDRTFTWQLQGQVADGPFPYRYLQGHMGLPTADRLLPGARLVTILRDPVRRLVSSYFYWRSQSERVGRDWDAHEIAVRLADLSLLEFLESEDPVIRRATWNIQARLLAGADYGTTSAGRTQLFGFEDTQAPELAERAIAGMDRFAVVATVARFQDSMEQAYETLGLPGKAVVVETNRTPSKYMNQPITDEVIAAARRLTEADEVLFKAAEARLAVERGDATAALSGSASASRNRTAGHREHDALSRAERGGAASR